MITARAGVLVLGLALATACSTAPSSLAPGPTAEPAVPTVKASGPTMPEETLPAPVAALPSPARATPTPVVARRQVTSPSDLAPVLPSLSALPAGYQVASDTARSAADVARAYADPAARMARLVELGFEGGWRRTFVRAHASGTQQILTAGSLYTAPAGARAAYDEALKDLQPVNEPARTVTVLPVPEGLAAPAHYVEIVGTSGDYRSTFYVLLFQSGRLVVTVQSVGLGTDADPALAQDIARALHASAAP